MNSKSPRNYVELNDQELVQCVREGDQAAFEEIVSRYQQRLYQTALTILKSHYDAQEVTQDAWVKAYRA